MVYRGVQGQPGLHREILLKNKTGKKTKEERRGGEGRGGEGRGGEGRGGSDQIRSISNIEV
jgi:hypothetical protein